MDNTAFSDSSVYSNGFGGGDDHLHRKITPTDIDYNLNELPAATETRTAGTGRRKVGIVDDRKTSTNSRKVSTNSRKASTNSRKVSTYSRKTSSQSRKVSVLPELAPEDPGTKSFARQTTEEKTKSVFMGILKFLGLLTCLYFFICSLDLLSSGFKLLGGKTTGQIFQQSDLLTNPVCGLMIGVMATVMVQSSSTSTSIVVAMTGSGIINIDIAIPIIMGANVGTSVTNTLVSLAQVGDRDQFERAFAGATVHDMFNWLSVAVLLPLELATQYLAKLTGAIVGSGGANSTSGAKIQLLTVLTDPLTELIVQIDDSVIQDTAAEKQDKNKTGGGGGGEQVQARVLKIWCKNESAASAEAAAVYATDNDTTPSGQPPGTVKCHHLFATWPEMTDSVAGAIILVISLLVLCTSLILLVKILNGVFKGSVGRILQRFLNAEFPGILRYLTDYAAMLVGAIVTILVQSSSVFTSTLTPLVGLGAVTIERFYPLTLGSNIGTTFTAMMAALAADGPDAPIALQIALCHLFFNLSGILLFYPVPFMRRMPIRLAQGLGAITAEYRWFCALYVIAMFAVLPAFILGLSMAGPIVFGIVFGIVLLFLLIVVLINVVQEKRPAFLPDWLKSWDFLPAPLRSLRPYDKVIVACALRCCACCACVQNLRRDTEADVGIAAAEGGRRRGFDDDDGGVDNEGAAVGEMADSIAMKKY